MKIDRIWIKALLAAWNGILMCVLDRFKEMTDWDYWEIWKKKVFVYLIVKTNLLIWKFYCLLHFTVHYFTLRNYKDDIFLHYITLYFK